MHQLLVADWLELTNKEKDYRLSVQSWRRGNTPQIWIPSINAGTALVRFVFDFNEKATAKTLHQSYWNIGKRFYIPLQTVHKKNTFNMISF